MTLLSCEDVPINMQDAADLASGAALLNDLGKEFAILRSDVERLTSSLSDSVHEATQLTLTHTRLYDSAVGVLQVSHFLPYLNIHNAPRSVYRCKSCLMNPANSLPCRRLRRKRWP